MDLTRHTPILRCELGLEASICRNPHDHQPIEIYLQDHNALKVVELHVEGALKSPSVHRPRQWSLWLYTLGGTHVQPAA